MICHNCKSEMPDNMKFCTKCGISLRNDAAVVQQAPAYQKEQQMSVYNSASQYAPQIPIGMQLHKAQKKNKTLKVWVGVLAATTVMFIFLWITSLSELNYYENRSAFDKTVDAVDSWVDILGPIVDMVK